MLAEEHDYMKKKMSRINLELKTRKETYDVLCDDLAQSHERIIELQNYIQDKLGELQDYTVANLSHQGLLKISSQWNSSSLRRMMNRDYLKHA